MRNHFAKTTVMSCLRKVREKSVNFTRFVDRPPVDEVGEMGSGLRKYRQIFVATRPNIRIILLHGDLSHLMASFAQNCYFPCFFVLFRDT